MVDGEPVEMQLRDQYGRLMFTDFEEELDEQGNPTGEIVMETVMDADVVYVEVEQNNGEYVIVEGAYYTIAGNVATEIEGFSVKDPAIYPEVDDVVTTTAAGESKYYMKATANDVQILTTDETPVDAYVEVDETGDEIVSTTTFYKYVDDAMEPATVADGVTADGTVGDLVTIAAAGDSATYLPVYSDYKVVSKTTTTEIIQDKDVFGRLVFEDVLTEDTQITTTVGEGEQATEEDVYVMVIEEEADSGVYTPVKSNGKYVLVTITGDAETGFVATPVEGMEPAIVVVDSEDGVVTADEKDYLPAYTPKEVEVYIYDENGEIVKRHLLYITGEYAYYQMVDDEGKPVYDEATGMPVYDMDKPIMIDVTMTVPNYDEDSAPVYAYVVPETTEVPKYDVDSEPVTVTVTPKVPATDAQGNPVYEQEVNELGLPVYKKYLYQQLKFETGQINGGVDKDNYVWMQKVNGDGTLKFDKNGNPVYDYTKPVYDFTAKAPVYAEVDDQNEPKATDGKYTYVSILESIGKVTVLGTTEVKPVVDVGTVITVTTGSNSANYAIVTGYYDGDVEKSGKFYAYDSKSQPVYVQETEEKIFTQVGFPYEEEVFDYTVRIVYNAGVAQFDTDDYTWAVYGKGEMPAPYEEGTDRAVYAPEYDKDGKLVIIDDKVVDSDTKLFTWDYILVEQDGASYIVPTGVEYQPD